MFVYVLRCLTSALSLDLQSSTPPNDKEDAIRKFYHTMSFAINGEGDGPQEERFKLSRIAK